METFHHYRRAAGCMAALPGSHQLSPFSPVLISFASSRGLEDTQRQEPFPPVSVINYREELLILP